MFFYLTDVQQFSLLEAAAQAFVFFVGGFETSSTTMQFALYELAKNKDIQDRLREEIRSVMDKHNGEITYDGINEMEYLDRVVAGLYTNNVQFYQQLFQVLVTCCCRITA